VHVPGRECLYRVFGLLPFLIPDFSVQPLRGTGAAASALLVPSSPLHRTPPVTYLLAYSFRIYLFSNAFDALCADGVRNPIFRYFIILLIFCYRY
jgi:hypothetical protein